MVGWVARVFLVRFLGRRIIPILTVVELVQLLRRRRDGREEEPAAVRRRYAGSRTRRI